MDQVVSLSKNLGSGALSGVRIVDFSWVLAGPMCTKLLAAMGAEVIKIETTFRPEHLRRGRFFPLINTSKLSVTIDMTKPEGQVLLRRLIKVSDIVVENFSAGVLPKYGLGYEDLKAVRPDLIFASASGVGRTGPYRDALAYRTLLQAYAARAGMIGEINIDLEGMGIHGWTDPITAIWECLAIMAAYYNRQTSGAGAFIDLSMLESTVALLPESLFREALGDTGAAANANAETDAAPSGCFRCGGGEDDWIAVSVKSDKEWQSLCAVMKRPDLAVDKRFADAALRLTNRAELDAIFAQWARTVLAEEIEKQLQKNGIAAARSRNIMDLMSDAHLTERGIFAPLPNNRCSPSLPWRDEDGSRGDIRPAPALGADNDYVFGEILGLSRKEINDLMAAEVILPVNATAKA